MLRTADEIAQHHHARTNPLAMSGLTYSPAERGLLVALDAALAEIAALKRRVFRLEGHDH